MASERFWEPFWLFFGAILGAVLGPESERGEKVKIELSSTRELNFQGPGTSKIVTFSAPFLRGAPRAHRIYLFMDFVDFGAIFGPPWAPPERFFSNPIFGYVF